MKVILVSIIAGLAVLSPGVPQSRPVLHVQPVYENGVEVACLHYYSVPLKAGGEFHYQWQPELVAFRATNGAALR